MTSRTTSGSLRPQPTARVSAEWASNESARSRTAARPPLAQRVLPSSTGPLVRTATEAPASAALRAAVPPAEPAPRTSTSKRSWGTSRGSKGTRYRPATVSRRSGEDWGAADWCKGADYRTARKGQGASQEGGIQHAHPPQGLWGRPLGHPAARVNEFRDSDLVRRTSADTLGACSVPALTATRQESRQPPTSLPPRPPMAQIVQAARQDLASYLVMGSLVLCTFLV